MTFQKKVSLGPAKGWEGDFASTNVRVSFLGDPQSEEVTVVDREIQAGFTLKSAYYQAGVGGVRAGSFVWVDEATKTIMNTGEGSPAGFVGRELTGVPASYLEEASSQIPAGFMVTVYSKGEFLVNVPDDAITVQRGEVVRVTVEGKLTVSDDGIVTTYKYVTSAKVGELVAVSSWI